MGFRLKSRDKSPVNGFWVNIPQTNFNRQYWKFSEAVNALWDHLQGNPGVLERFKDLPQTKAACEDFIDRANAARMLSIKGASSFIVSDDLGPIPKSLPPQHGRFASVAGGVRKMAAGVATLLMWLGKGGAPVPAELSAKRSMICARRSRPDGSTYKCPKNVNSDLTSLFTMPVANLLRKQLQVRNDMKLTTPHDERLGVCDACACPLKLKVHTPLADIVEHMTDTVKNDLDPECWILNEK